MGNNNLLTTICQNYEGDKLFSLILDKPKDYKEFTMANRLVWQTNLHNNEVLCIPRQWDIVMTIITQAHNMLGHFGNQHTMEYIHRWYWWPQMHLDIHEFCRTCDLCQWSKKPYRKLAGKLHNLPIPTKPWNSIGMDFVGPFPESKGFNYLWVILCQMTSMVHLIPVYTTMKASELSWIYRCKIVHLHGLPSSIVSDRDPKFTLKWWRELHKILGAKLLISMSFHSQMDRQTKHINCSVGQIFHTIVRPDQKDWVNRLNLTKFAINVSISETTKYAPFELNGGYMPSMIKKIHTDRIIPKGIQAFAQQALQKLADTHDMIIELQVFQTHNANHCWWEEPTISIGDLVYLLTHNLKLPQGQAKKLCPNFVGPYKVLHAKPKSSNYTLELPTALQK